MRGLQYSLLAGIILVVLIVVVGSIMIQPVGQFDVTKYFGLQPVLGTQGNGGIGSSNPSAPFGGTLKKVDNIVTAEGQVNQPIEVACSIANGIYDDFSANGLGVRKDTECASQEGYSTPNVIQQCLVDYGVFRLTDTIHDESFASKLEENGCHDCYTSSSDNIFDETCINYDLSGRTIPATGGTSFCNSGFTPSGSTKLVYFGNNQCFNTDNSNSWDDGTKCREYCGNSACTNNCDMIKWIADNVDGKKISTSTQPEVMIKDNFLYQKTDANQGNDWSLSKNQNYMYGLVWVPDRASYDLLFVRFPTTTASTSFDFIKDAFQDYERYNKLGIWRQEARMVADFIVTPTSSSIKSIADIAGDVKSVTGVEPTISTTCSTDCISTVSQNSQSPEYPSVPTEITSDLFEEKPVIIKTNLNVNEKLIAGNSYRVVVMNWYGLWHSQGSENRFQFWDRTVSITDVTDSVSIVTIGLSPSSSGTFCAQSGTNSVCAPNADTKLTIFKGTDVTFSATPSAGYKIGHFTDANGKTYTPAQVGCPTDTTKSCSFSRTISVSSGEIKVAFIPVGTNNGAAVWELQDSTNDGSICVGTNCASNGGSAIFLYPNIGSGITVTVTSTNQYKIACIKVIGGLTPGESCGSSPGAYSLSYVVAGDVTMQSDFKDYCTTFATQSTCPTSVCKWCSACNSQSQQYHTVNQWGSGKCVNSNTNCGYHCVVGQCGALCQQDSQCNGPLQHCDTSLTCRCN